MQERIGILTGGGDCPGLNTVIRSVVKTADRRGWATVGFLGGFEGLLRSGAHRTLDVLEMDRLLFRGGTILGTSNRGPFTAKTGAGESRAIDPGILAEARETAETLGLRCLICLGGDGSMTISQQLFEAGLPTIGVPKTIDNDLAATDVTFGFETAVETAVDALDRLRSTAESHRRVMVLEVMGRYAGWIAGYAGLAGGADVILLPEIPYDFESIVAKIRAREARGKDYTLVVVAEGARARGGDYVTTGGDSGDTEGEIHLGGVGHLVAAEIARRTGKETRCTVLGHLQRGGKPNSWDRLLCTRFGVAAVELAADGRFGHMVALRGTEMRAVPLREVIGRIRTVDPEGELVRAGRALGVSFGAEELTGA